MQNSIEFGCRFSTNSLVKISEMFKESLWIINDLKSSGIINFRYLVNPLNRIKNLEQNAKSFQEMLKEQ